MRGEFGAYVCQRQKRILKVSYPAPSSPLQFFISGPAVRPLVTSARNDELATFSDYLTSPPTAVDSFPKSKSIDCLFVWDLSQRPATTQVSFGCDFMYLNTHYRALCQLLRDLRRGGGIISAKLSDFQLSSSVSALVAIILHPVGGSFAKYVQLSLSQEEENTGLCSRSCYEGGCNASECGIGPFRKHFASLLLVYHFCMNTLDWQMCSGFWRALCRRVSAHTSGVLKA